MNDLFFDPREVREFINFDDFPGNDGNGNNWPEPEEEIIEPENDEE